MIGGKSTGKLLQAFTGRAYVAQVSVTLVDRQRDVVLAGHVVRGDGHPVRQGFVAAAISGCRVVVEAIPEAGHYSVVINRIVATDVDSTVGSVRCAAIVATLMAFGRNVDLLEFALDDSGEIHATPSSFNHVASAV